MKLICTSAMVAVGFAAGQAAGQQYEVPWHTIDGGGGTSSGGSFTLSGTIGQHDAGGPMTGGSYSLTGGFWAGTFAEPCVGDFNGDGTVNTLDVLAFLNAWTAGEGSADINDDGTVNTLDVLAFLNFWAAGC
ncbi:MAG: GC-type dockerin domain-anchored protein [Phycisphaerales bacterium JB041]